MLSVHCTYIINVIVALLCSDVRSRSSETIKQEFMHWDVVKHCKPSSPLFQRAMTVISPVVAMPPEQVTTFNPSVAWGKPTRGMQLSFFGCDVERIHTNTFFTIQLNFCPVKKACLVNLNGDTHKRVQTEYITISY